MKHQLNNSESFIYIETDAVEDVITSHNSGIKKVLCPGFPGQVQMKQVAVGYLHQGEKIPAHVHVDMDEYYFVIEGSGTMYINEDGYEMKKGIFINVPAGNEHKLESNSTLLQFFYFGLQIL